MDPRFTMGRTVVPAIGCVLVAMILLKNSLAELYTSTDELSYWTTNRNRIVDLMDRKMDEYTARIENLKQLRQVLVQVLDLDASKNETSESLKRPDKLMKLQLSHPVGAFLALNRLVDDLNEARYILEADKTPHGVVKDFEKLLEEGNMPTEDDAIGSGHALLRLQRFYDLATTDLAQGKIIFNNQRIDDNTDNLQMNYDDLFLLGKLAVDSEDYKLAMEWLTLAIHRAHEEELHNSVNDLETEKYNYLLEYLSYSAYKINRIKLAAQLTQLWAERNPHDEKAIRNSNYYKDRFARVETSADPGDENEPESELHKHQIGKKDHQNVDVDPSHYLADTARFCQSSEVSLSNSNKCLQLTDPRSENFGLKVEILNDSPRVIRVYDILTDKEAQDLKKEAWPLLERSTVGQGATFKESDTRIAKTAWLPDRPNSTANNLKSRVQALLKLDLSTAERLQVVNYGLGGFYDLHWDAFSIHEDVGGTDDRAAMLSRVDNNRVATVLIYLEDVRAGGATIFPTLKLHAQPIKRSAIIWYNLHKNRTIDTRTKHMGCPVLLGSKWIATIWPREKGNTFLRPCGLREDE